MYLLSMLNNVEDFVGWLEETPSLIEHACAQDVSHLSSVVGY